MLIDLAIMTIVLAVLIFVGMVVVDWRRSYTRRAGWRRHRVKLFRR
jgi:hypothetical protein